jgi:protein-L-isoaspartate(D-aspartate) O-methyltransferase
MPAVEAPASGTPSTEPAPQPAAQPADDRADERERMVAHQIAARGVTDPLVLAAMRRVPRHLFMPADRRDQAYEDRPVPIGWDQTISQPYIVASMTEEARVEPDSRVLEIGTGSGYQAAILAAITDHVFSIEIKAPLAERARASLDAAGFEQVTTKHGDGYDGWAEHAPFDAIVVTAAAPHVPPPLVRQLAPGGRMVIPVGPAMAVQDLMLVTKDAEGTVRTKSLYRVRFVPLTGAGAEK